MATNIWDTDRLTEIDSLLCAAGRLWTEQCFTKPTEDRTKEIITGLLEAHSALADVIEDLAHYAERKGFDVLVHIG